jgi:hypothetical protein
MHEMKGHSPNDQECWGMARFVKLQWCQPLFVARLGGGGILGVSVRGCRPQRWPSPMCGQAQQGQSNGF